MATHFFTIARLLYRFYPLGAIAPIPPPMLRANPPHLAKPLLTPSERAAFGLLRAGLPYAWVFPQVSHSVIAATADWAQSASRRATSQFTVDFVVCRQDLSVLAIVELDDPSHDTPACMYLDQERDAATRMAGYPTLRVNARLGPYFTMADAVADIAARQADPRHPLRYRPLVLQPAGMGGGAGMSLVSGNQAPHDGLDQPSREPLKGGTDFWATGFGRVVAAIKRGWGRK